MHSHRFIGFMAVVIGFIVGRANASQPTLLEVGTSRKQTVTLRPESPLMIVPVTVRDSHNSYIVDLKKDDFIMTDNGVEQQITLFARPGHSFFLALLIDTTESSLGELSRIQRAALTFIRQLDPGGKVMVVSLDEEVQVKNDFTSDRSILASSINHLHSGETTRLYEAVGMVVQEKMKQVGGPKALILFTDGVDTSGQYVMEGETVGALEESNALVYSIRYDTRLAVRRRLRRPKKTNVSDAPAPVENPPSGAEHPNRKPPSEEPTRRWPSPYPPPWPSGVPFPNPTSLPNPNPYPNPGPYPTRYPRRSPSPGAQPTPTPEPQPKSPLPTHRQSPRSPNDPLELEYQRGEKYLWELADRTGGIYYEAKSLKDLPHILESVSEDLGHRYILGYTRPRAEAGDQYRRIKVKVIRRGLHVRARPGYRTK